MNILNRDFDDLDDSRVREYDPDRVQKEKCSTCPFRPESPLSHLVPELTVRVLTESNHFCHAQQLGGMQPDVICRGGRDVQLRTAYQMGVISEPTDEAWAREISGVSDG